MNITKEHIIRIVILIVTQLIWSSNLAQSTYPTRDSTYIFWQPNLKIQFTDYKAAPHSATKPTIATVALWTALDLPEEKDSEKQVKFYLAPVFDRSSSSTITDDSIKIAMQNTYLDICEIWARWARKKLNKLQDSITQADTLSKVFSKIIYEMNEHRLRMYRKYYKEVFRENKENAFTEWRDTINKKLADTKEWATKPEECYRFISNKPLEEGYREDTKSNPPTLDGVYEHVLQRDTWHWDFPQITRHKSSKK